MVIKDRIGIIGAGPAGLAAAEALKDKGYINVTILEKRKRVGGQSLSKVFVKPNHEKIIYELGSVQPIGTNFGVINKLMKRFNIGLGRTITSHRPAHFRLYNFETHQVDLDFSKYKFGRPLSLKFIYGLIHDFLKLAFALYRFRELAKPGFARIPDHLNEELSIPYEQWLDQQHFWVIGQDLKFMLGSMLTFSNAENRHHIPAVKFIKFLLDLLKPPHRYIDGTYLPISEGYQELWKRVAQQHDVRPKTIIKKIYRESDEVIVKTDQEEFRFDKLIVSCPPYELHHFLELTDQEKAIFSKIKYCPGWRAAFTAKHLPHDAAYFFVESYLFEDKAGIALFIPEGQVDDETWLYGCVLAENRKAKIHDLKADAEITLEKEFGATDIKWEKNIYWKEFAPYFDSAEVKDKIYHKIEDLQGQNHTYYIGDAISGGTHAIVAEYAYDLVNKYF